VRPGELVAFSVDDLDLEDCIVKVQRYRTKFQTTKSTNGVRLIAISEGLADSLRQHLVGWRPNPRNLIFPGERKNGPLHPSSVVREHLKPLCKKLGIVPRGMNAFRHCSASMMDHLNIPMKIRQERHGHAPGTKITMVHYTHAVSADARMAANALGSLLVN
jgi:integrase